MHRARHRSDPRWRAGLTDLARLVLPTACAGCARDDVPLCGACHATLAGPARFVPVLTHVAAPPTWCVADYTGTTREVVLAWKDRGRHDLSGVLCAALVRPVLAAAAHPGAGARDGRQVLLVPAPSSRAATRARGGDLLAGVAARTAALLRTRGHDVVAVSALRQRYGVRDQAGLDVAARQRNVDGAFAVRARRVVASSPCLLVDDVATTGATLAEMARALTSAGSVVLGAAVIAATPSRRRDEAVGLSAGRWRD